MSLLTVKFYIILHQHNLIFYLFAYLLGSIPSSIWAGKWFYKVDIRAHGSGNAGTTNTFRVLGYKAAIPVLIVDIFKGFLAVKLINYFEPLPAIESSTFITIKIVLGLMAVLGHLYPIFAKFKGGKGVATIFGAVLALDWQSALIAFAIFWIIFFATNFVSLSALCASLSYTIVGIIIELKRFVNADPRGAMIVFPILVTILLFYTHRSNIKRLWNRSESKIFLIKKPG